MQSIELIFKNIYLEVKKNPFFNKILFLKQINSLIALTVEPGEDWKDVQIPAILSQDSETVVDTITAPAGVNNNNFLREINF